MPMWAWVAGYLPRPCLHIAFLPKLQISAVIANLHVSVCFPSLQISAAISDVVQQKLGVPKNRFYIKFVDVDAADYGYDGSTFA